MQIAEKSIPAEQKGTRISSKSQKLSFLDPNDIFCPTLYFGIFLLLSML